MNPAHPGVPTLDLPSDPERRVWLAATAAASGVAAVATAFPLVSSFAPSERARAAGGPVEVDIADLPPGGAKTAEWRGKPVWVVRRTPEMLAALQGHDAELADPGSAQTQQPGYAKNPARAIRPEVFVAIGICTHLGCVPNYEGAIKPEPFDPNWKGGFYCPCHKSRYDMAGRVFEGVPAPANLAVPKYHFVDDAHIMIGVDPEGKA